MSDRVLPKNVILFPGVSVFDLPSSEEPSLRNYLGHVERSELEDAADCLSALLGMDEERAYHCTLRFIEQHKQDPIRATGKLMRLRLEACTGNNEVVMTLLRDCFGLVGAEAAGLVHPLRSMAHPDAPRG
jgi:hypothetical protein